MTYFEPKKKQNIEDQRISNIILEVHKMPGIHHNALRKIVVDEKKKMAKKTFDKLAKKLRTNGTLATVSQNDNKIHYVIPATTNEAPLDFEKEFEPYLKSMESKLSQLKKEYKLFPIQGKQTMMISTLSNIFSALTGITFINSIGNPSSEDLSKHEIRLRKCIRFHMDIMMHDKDRNLVVPVVQNAILQGFSITQILEFLKFSQTT